MAISISQKKTKTIELEKHLSRKRDVFSVRWNPARQQLAIAFKYGPLLVLNLENDKIIIETDSAVIAEPAIAWEGQGQLLAAASRENEVLVWRVASGTVEMTLLGHHGAILDISWCESKKPHCYLLR